MPRAARIAQADIARAMRAIEKAEGEWRLRILPDGSMVIERGEAGIITAKVSVAAREDIRL
jgi:hypothetical protein